jgi:peptidoglycan/LPS O-acetylase OafA/YrhL
MFFVLLSGFFHPIISGDDMAIGGVVYGTVTLAFGLFGGILVYKALTVQKRKMAYLASGLGIIGISLFGVFVLTGRLFF